MQFSHVIDPSLPPLAWCLKLFRDGHVASLVCGTSVQVNIGREAFFEGAWAGDFTEMTFDAAHAVFGSGARIIEKGGENGDAVLLVPPSHTCERIQYLHRPRTGETFASNSLAFLLEAAGEELDPNYAGYISDFERIVYGLDHADTRIPTRGGEMIHFVYHHNVCLTRAGEARLIEKPLAPAFNDYASYRAMMDATFRSLIDNARDPARNLAAARRAGGKNSIANATFEPRKEGDPSDAPFTGDNASDTATYEPLTSISTGYDSPAGAVLAAKVGCNRAITFAQARPERNGEAIEDSGAAIGQKLGMTVTEFARDDYLAATESSEAEFLATGMSGEDVIMTAFEPALRKTVFFTGFHGDKIWDKLAHIPPNAQLKRGDLSGGSLNEFRLRVDFIHVPVPFIAGRQLEAIDRISNREDMRPWSIGGDYDRPIPRRMVEEAGVPREAFGQSKKAATALIHLDGPKITSTRTREQIAAFESTHPLPPATFEALRRQEKSERRGFFAMRLLRKLNLLALAPSIAHRRFGIHNHSPRGVQMLHWSLTQVRPRYANASNRLRSQ